MAKRKPPVITQNSLALILNGISSGLRANADSLFPGMTRADFLAGGRGKEGTKKDLDKECDYPPRTTFNSTFYRELYDYVGPATRAINVYPSETWKAIPAVYETHNKRTTPWERKWWELTEDPQLCPYIWLRKVDERSLIGRYGALLIGLNDSPDFSIPAAETVNGKIIPHTGPARDLLYFRAFDESNCQINSFDTNTSSYRYGQPETYVINNLSDGDLQKSVLTGKKTTIHWTRILHVVYKDTEHPSFGVPVLQNLIPYIWDLRKVGGGSAEMFWQGANPGISFETMPEMITEGGNVELDEDSVKDQVEKYMRKLQRYIALTGVHANSLAPQVSDPTPHLKCAIDLLCLALDVPVPIFLGQQEGHLASMANKGAWGEKISGRRRNYASPNLIRGLIDRLAVLGVTPAPKQVVQEWVDANTSTDGEKATAALKRAQAFAQWANSNARFAMDRLTYLTEELGYSDEKAQEILARVNKEKDFVPESITNPTPKAPAGAAGRPAGTVSQS